jgi:hypothetical protein
MRSRLILKLRRAALAASAASMLAAPALIAQEEAAKAEDPAAQAEEPAKAEQPAKAEEARPAAAAKGETAPTPAAAEEGETQDYTIQKGDTLWDLSNKFLNNPWYWPKIWSLNPGIENPHWIYPGNPLKIRAGGKVGVTQVESENTAKEAEEEAEPSVPGKQKYDAVDLAVVRHGEREFYDDGVSASGKLAFEASDAIKVKPSGIISSDDLASAGELQGSFEEKSLLSMHDTAYAKFKDGGSAKVGAKYTIFRKEGPVLHPTTRQPVGERVRVLGEAKVLSVEKDVATVRLLSSNSEVERGDLIGTWTTTDLRQVKPKPNSKSVDAIILASGNEDLSALGQYHQVYLDRGSSDGVEEGNTFVVRRAGDGLGAIGGPLAVSYTDRGQGRAEDNPEESVGLLMVVDVKGKVSTALVLKAVRELQPGERAAMRPAGSGGF